MRLAGFFSNGRFIKVSGAVIEPKKLLGESIRVYLNERASDKAAFNFKVTAVGEAYISGYDAESENLRISIQDIDFITVKA